MTCFTSLSLKAVSVTFMFPLFLADPGADVDKKNENEIEMDEK